MRQKVAHSIEMLMNTQNTGVYPLNRALNCGFLLFVFPSFIINMSLGNFIKL